MPKLLFNFADPSAVQAWRAIDDRVMGGLSQSGLRFDPQGHATFLGEVSLERNGGFASVRSASGDHGMPGATACVLALRGGPRQFKLSLRTDDGFDSLNYQAGFAPTGNDWHRVLLPLAAFRPSFRGRAVIGAAVLAPERIRQIGLMIAARQAGRFALDVRSIGLV